MLEKYQELIGKELQLLFISDDAAECTEILNIIKIYQDVVSDLYEVLKSEFKEP